MRKKVLFKGKNSKILSALTFGDAAFWASDLFVVVIFALFITQTIDGGSALHVGLVYGLYRLVRAALAIPIGRYFDNRKGLIDEMWGVSFSALLTGSVYLVLFSVTQMWAVYVCMVFIAVGHSINVSSWRVLFYGSLDRDRQGQSIGVYETVMQVVYGLAAVLAGLIGDLYGFEWVMLIAGIVTILSGIFPLSVKNQLIT